MAFTPSTFKTKLASAGGPARPSLYKVKINQGTSGALTLSATETILVKAASMPASNIAPLAVNYAGRAYKWQGFRTYDIWTVTVINDESFSIRNKMMQWMRWLSGKMDGTRNISFGDPAQAGGWIDGDATVTQLATDGSDKQAYRMYNLWPTEIGEIAVDWSNDAIEEYTIGFAYDHWSSGTDANSSNAIVPPPHGTG
jgi:hypothetical protein